MMDASGSNKAPKQAPDNSNDTDDMIMSSSFHSTNNRRSSPITGQCEGDSNDAMNGMNSLKESLNSILQDDESKELRQRHKRISSGAQKIMEKLASLRSDDVARPESRHSHYRRRRRPRQMIEQEAVADAKKKSGGNDPYLDMSNYSFASRSTASTLDTSFASSLDDSLCKSHARVLLNQQHKNSNNDDKNDDSNYTNNSTHGDDNSSSNNKQPHQHQNRRTVTRRKSIPRHRDTEPTASCLRPTKYSNDKSLRTSDSTRRTTLESFGSSVDDFNSSLLSTDGESWVASGVVIDEKMEVIHMK